MVHPSCFVCSANGQEPRPPTVTTKPRKRNSSEEWGLIKRSVIHGMTIGWKTAKTICFFNHVVQKLLVKTGIDQPLSLLGTWKRGSLAKIDFVGDPFRAVDQPNELTPRPAHQNLTPRSSSPQTWDLRHFLTQEEKPTKYSL